MSKETEDLCKAVDEFADAMKARLIRKHKQGFGGWNALGEGVTEHLIARIDKKAARIYLNPVKFAQKHLVDLANYAMMLWWRRK